MICKYELSIENKVNYGDDRVRLLNLTKRTYEFLCDGEWIWMTHLPVLPKNNVTVIDTWEQEEE